MHVLGIVFAVVLTACLLLPPAAESQLESHDPTQVKPGDYEDTVIVDGAKRSYLVHVPQAYNGQLLPAIIVFHGGLADARMSQWNARMVDKGNKDNFFVVYPHGSSGVGKHLLTWNAGTCCGLASRKGADDIGFVKAMVGKLKADYTIDPYRVFVTGMSNGAMMAYRVACELPELIAAAAPVEGCMLSNKIIGPAPVSIVAFNGTEDHVVKYEGGYGSFFGYKITCPSVKDTVRLWAEHNHCYPVPKIEKSDDDIEKMLYSEGEEGTEVCLYTLRAGHTWPGGRSKMPFQKTTHSKFSATDAMCEFFWKHPKKPVLK